MKSKYQKWFKNNLPGDSNGSNAKYGWNAACKSIVATIKRRNKAFEGHWQHEDIEFLMEDIKDMISK